MDENMYIAACTGNVVTLQELERADPLILCNASLEPSNNPLPIAALLGHSEFARLVMTRNPDLARQLNQQGYGPIHLAASKGHLQIVEDLLMCVGEGLCCQKDRDGRTPLHCAGINGKLDVVRKILQCCPESAKEVTFKGETMLHLVVKNNQCEVTLSLLPLLGEFNLLDELINLADEDGNTILHLAYARKQHQIIKVLLKDTNVNVDAVNANGDTASAISESGDMNVGRLSQPTPHQRGPDYQASVKNGLIVFCSLLAAFCLESILSLPGGLEWKEEQSSSRNSTQDTHKFAYDRRLEREFSDFLIPKKEIRIPLNKFVYFFIFINSDVTCFLSSMLAIFTITLTSSYETSLPVAASSGAIGVVILSAMGLYYSALVLATNESIAMLALRWGTIRLLFLVGLVYTLIVLFWGSVKLCKMIAKAWKKIRDRSCLAVPTHLAS